MENQHNSIIRAKRKSLWQHSYDLFEDDEIVASINTGWWSGARFKLKGYVYQVSDEVVADSEKKPASFTITSPLRRQHFKVFDGKDVLLTCRKPQSFFSGVEPFSFTFQEHQYALSFSYGKIFEVKMDGMPIGNIRFKGKWAWEFIIDLPRKEPLLLKVFLFYLFMHFVHT